MVDKFIIVLFKNKLKKKIINKFKTFKKAKNFYDDLLNKSENVIFDKKWENAVECKYDIALLEKNGINEIIYTTDELGRNIKVNLEDDNYTFRKITPYKLEEKIYDLQLNRRISISELIKKYLSGLGIKLISSLNNKIVIQQDDNFSIFSTKNTEESHRLVDSLTKHFINIGRSDFIFVKDIDSAQRAYLYKILDEKGFDKKMLYRTKTTYLPR
jgi:hypothetical protein